MKKQPERPAVITDAARSPRDQLRSREIRYVSMMGLRAACLITGAILISVKPPLLPVWLILCAAGMVILPWMAVLIANDRPAKTRAERAQSQRPAPTHQALDQKPADEREHRVIDADG